jgi:hypothetical protein
MLTYSSFIELNQYRKDSSLSQSFLKQVLANDVKEVKQTVPMIIGSLLDAKLTSPHLVDDLFHRGIVKRPSDTIKGFIDDLYAKELDLQEREGTKVYDLEEYKEYLIFAAREANYQPRWGDDAIWNAISKEGNEYWNELKEAKGKVIITDDEWQQTEIITALTLSSSVTGKYFIDQKAVDIYYQYPMYWNFGRHAMKGLADLVVIEHETSTAYLIDIKSTTSKKIEDWFSIARSKAYPFQLSMYEHGLQTNLKELNAENYKIKCRWIVIPYNTENFTPWVIPCTDIMLQAGKYGYRKLKTFDITNSIKDFGIGSNMRYGWLDALNVYEKSQEMGLKDYNVKWNSVQGKMSEQDTEDYFFV